jgi:hypothetical protein
MILILALLVPASAAADPLDLTLPSTFRLAPVSLLPTPRFAAGFTVTGDVGALQPVLEVCGPEVTLSLRFGPPPKARRTPTKR